MKSSESLKELGTALCKAQSAVKVALKTSDNPFFKSSYADLSAVWEACREALTKNNLSVIQTIGEKDSKPTLTTMILHGSGEFISDTLLLPILKPGPQDMGSCIKYMRRYALASIVGVIDGQDDDAERAEGRVATGTQKPHGEAVAAFKRATVNHAPSSNAASDYPMPFGKSKGTKLCDMSLVDVESAIDWAVSKNKFLDFVSVANQYLQEAKMQSSDLVPNFNPSDELPF